MSLRRSQQCATAEGAKYSHPHVALTERVTQRACGAYVALAAWRSASHAATAVLMLLSVM